MYFNILNYGRPRLKRGEAFLRLAIFTTETHEHHTLFRININTFGHLSFAFPHIEKWESHHNHNNDTHDTHQMYDGTGDEMSKAKKSIKPTKKNERMPRREKIHVKWFCGMHTHTEWSSEGNTDSKKKTNKNNIIYLLFVTIYQEAVGNPTPKISNFHWFQFSPPVRHSISHFRCVSVVVKFIFINLFLVRFLPLTSLCVCFFFYWCVYFRESGTKFSSPETKIQKRELCVFVRHDRDDGDDGDDDDDENDEILWKKCDFAAGTKPNSHYSVFLIFHKIGIQLISFLFWPVLTGISYNSFVSYSMLV